jgi:large subunit ribosomal protein L23
VSRQSPHWVIRHPLVTEKSTLLREKDGRYCFRADRRANKIEIARAIEALFDGVKVAEVRTSVVRGKVKRQGRFQGKAPDWKKAWVRLAPNSKQIEFFEAT